jgi:hypothetical protein
MAPNVSKLSGERSGAERVRCSAVFGGMSNMLTAPHDVAAARPDSRHDHGAAEKKRKPEHEVRCEEQDPNAHAVPRKPQNTVQGSSDVSARQDAYYKTRRSTPGECERGVGDRHREKKANRESKQV